MATNWLGKIRCAVMLTFDVDGVSSRLHSNPNFAKFPSLMSMLEFGPSVATPRILELLDSYDIKGSFFIPGYIVETHEELVQKIVSHGHELGHHGYMHEPPSTMDKQQEEDVLDQGIEILKQITGHAPKGYRSPSFELSEHSLSLLASRDFLYDSSLMGDDSPYTLDAGSKQLVEIPVHWSLDDGAYWNFIPAENHRFPPMSPEFVYNAWSEAFLEIYERGGAFCLTLHPQRIGRPGRLRMLERLVRKMRSYPGVAFMRCSEVADLWKGK